MKLTAATQKEAMDFLDSQLWTTFMRWVDNGILDQMAAMCNRYLSKPARTLYERILSEHYTE